MMSCDIEVGSGSVVEYTLSDYVFYIHSQIFIIKNITWTWT